MYHHSRAKKILSFNERNGLVRKNFDFNFSLSLRKPNLKSEINLSGESGAAKLRFIEWLNRTEEDEKPISDNQSSSPYRHDEA